MGEIHQSFRSFSECGATVHIHHPVGNLCPSIRIAPDRDSRGTNRSPAWFQAQPLRFRATDKLSDFLFELSNSFAGARGYRNHGTAELGMEFRHVTRMLFRRAVSIMFSATMTGQSSSSTWPTRKIPSRDSLRRRDQGGFGAGCR